MLEDDCGLTLDEGMKLRVESDYKFERKCEEKAKELAKHIKAILKVGRENAMCFDDIKMHLEHHGLVFEEYNFRDALIWVDDDVKTGDERTMLYLRESKEAKRGYWY